jgi:Tfp pilus assembly protein FimT
MIIAPMTRGATLLELLLALLVLALLAALAVSRVIDVADRAAVAVQAARVRHALEAARGTGLRLGTVAALQFGAGVWEVRVTLNGVETVAWRSPGIADDVTLEGGGEPLRFGTAGLAVGVSNRTLRLRRGTAAREIVVSRLGRVR